MIILAIGSNLKSNFGNRFENINTSIGLLEGYDIKLLKKSSFYESPSYPDKTNPKFINVVIQVASNLPPEDFASVLIFIEEKIGRKRLKKNDPRTCDIDIIDYKSKTMNFVYNNMNFIVPHQKLTFRNFVLYPLKEIFPEWRHPKTNISVDQLIQNLPNEQKNSILKVTKY